MEIKGELGLKGSPTFISTRRSLPSPRERIFSNAFSVGLAAQPAPYSDIIHEAIREKSSPRPFWA
jgi:hypothetical protein